MFNVLKKILEVEIYCEEKILYYYFFLSSSVLKQDISKNNNKNDHLLNPNGQKREWCAKTHHLFTEGHHIM